MMLYVQHSNELEGQFKSNDRDKKRRMLIVPANNDVRFMEQNIKVQGTQPSTIIFVNHLMRMQEKLPLFLATYVWISRLKHRSYQ